MSRSPDRFCELIEEIGGPHRYDRAPQQISGSLFVSLPADAWRSADVNPDDPRQIEQHWFPDEDVIILDLDPDHEPDTA